MNTGGQRSPLRPFVVHQAHRGLMIIGSIFFRLVIVNLNIFFMQLTVQDWIQHLEGEPQPQSVITPSGQETDHNGIRA